LVRLCHGSPGRGHQHGRPGQQNLTHRVPPAFAGAPAVISGLCPKPASIEDQPDLWQTIAATLPSAQSANDMKNGINETLLLINHVLISP
jgi:hypothetical protein